MSTTTCYAASVEDVVTRQLQQMKYEKLLLRVTSTETLTSIQVYCHQTIILKLSNVVTITLFAIQDGHTALRTASFNGHQKVLELLLGAGANPDLQDKVTAQQDSGVHSKLMALCASCEARSPPFYACMQYYSGATLSIPHKYRYFYQDPSQLFCIF